MYGFKSSPFNWKLGSFSGLINILVFHLKKPCSENVKSIVFVFLAKISVYNIASGSQLSLASEHQVVNQDEIIQCTGLILLQLIE